MGNIEGSKELVKVMSERLLCARKGMIVAEGDVNDLQVLNGEIIDLSFSSSHTFVGTYRDVATLSNTSARPSWPSLPRPVKYSSFCTVKMPVCPPPQTTLMAFCGSVSIFLGKSRWVLVPWPS